jgi:hypothetical protein
LGGAEPVLETVPPKADPPVGEVSPKADKHWQGNEIVKRPYKQGTYTKQEVALLKKEYPVKSAVVLAVKLKRSLISVQRQLRRLHIGRRRQSSWTPKQLKLLRKIYKATATWEIANQLDKTPSEIKRKAAELRLKK